MIVLAIPPSRGRAVEANGRLRSRRPGSSAVPSEAAGLERNADLLKRVEVYASAPRWRGRRGPQVGSITEPDGATFDAQG